MGLIPGHAYALIEVTVVCDWNYKEARLCKIRNPWGRGEWKGAWSDKSETWTPKAKKWCECTD